MHRQCVSLLQACGSCFRLTFESDQSTYAILEHVTSVGSLRDFSVSSRNSFSGTLYTAKQ